MAQEREGEREEAEASAAPVDRQLPQPAQAHSLTQWSKIEALPALRAQPNNGREGATTRRNNDWQVARPISKVFRCFSMSASHVRPWRTANITVCAVKSEENQSIRAVVGDVTRAPAEHAAPAIGTSSRLSVSRFSLTACPAKGQIKLESDDEEKRN